MKPQRPAISLLLAAVALGPGSVAFAETFHGWRYSPPKGYTVEQLDDHVALTRFDGSTICSLSLFGPRRSEFGAQQEAAIDWNGFVENTFQSMKITGRGSMQTDHGIDVTVTRAVGKDSAGARFGAIQYGLATHGLVGSAFVLASTPSLSACEPAAKQFLESLAVDWSAPQIADPEARAETLVGRWASSRTMTVPLPGGRRLTGIARSEYTFAVDGTYVYQSKQVGEPETIRTIVERGTYASTGYELTLIPSSATVSLEVHGRARQAAALPHPRRTYLWDKSYQVDANHWRLELTPCGKHVREGEKANATLVYPDASAKGFTNM